MSSATSLFEAAAAARLALIEALFAASAVTWDAGESDSGDSDDSEQQHTLAYRFSSQATAADDPVTLSGAAGTPCATLRSACSAYLAAVGGDVPAEPTRLYAMGVEDRLRRLVASDTWYRPSTADAAARRTADLAARVAGLLGNELASCEPGFELVTPNLYGELFSAYVDGDRERESSADPAGATASRPAKQIAAYLEARRTFPHAVATTDDMFGSAATAARWMSIADRLVASPGITRWLEQEMDEERSRRLGSARPIDIPHAGASNRPARPMRRSGTMSDVTRYGR